MSFEPDSIILPMLIPWIEESKLRVEIFRIIFLYIGVTLIYIWLTNFFIPVYGLSTIIALVFIYIALTQINGESKEKVAFSPKKISKGPTK